MRMRTTWVGGVMVALALTGGAGALTIAAQTHHPASAPAMVPSAGHDAMRMPGEMTVAMQARDARLASLVKTMDGATGDAKIETIAAIIRELVQNEKQMQATVREMRAHETPPSPTPAP